VKSESDSVAKGGMKHQKQWRRYRIINARHRSPSRDISFIAGGDAEIMALRLRASYIDAGEQSMYVEK